MDCFESAAEERTRAVSVFRSNVNTCVGTDALWMNFHNNDTCMEAILGW